MKRFLLFALFFGAICLLEPTSALAQGTSLDTRALREDCRRLQSQLADLLEAHNALKSELSKLRSEVRQLRAQTATKDPAAVTRADLEGLATSIRVTPIRLERRQNNQAAQYPTQFSTEL